MPCDDYFRSAYLVSGTVRNLDAASSIREPGQPGSASSMLYDTFTSLRVQLGFRTWNEKAQ